MGLYDKPEVSVLLGIIQLSSIVTYEHSIRVAEITENILEEASAEYTTEEKEQIITGALLHDIGKAFLPFNMASSSIALSYEEMGVVRVHTYLGYDILKNAFSEIIFNIALMHHERCDGTGYPSGVPLRNLPNYVLIVQVADIFDAICSDRPYKDGRSKEDAFHIMEKECKMIRLDDEYVGKLKKTAGLGQ